MADDLRDAPPSDAGRYDEQRNSSLLGSCRVTVLKEEASLVQALPVVGGQKDHGSGFPPAFTGGLHENPDPLVDVGNLAGVEARVAGRPSQPVDDLIVRKSTSTPVRLQHGQLEIGSKRHLVHASVEGRWRGIGAVRVLQVNPEEERAIAGQAAEPLERPSGRLPDRE